MAGPAIAMPPRASTAADRIGRIMADSLRRAALRHTGKLEPARALGKVLAAVLFISLGAMATAGAQGLTGERLYQICRDRTSAEWQEAGHYLCPGYIRGIIDGARLQALRDAKGSIPDHFKTLMICDPPTATGDEAIDIVVRFLEAQPEMRPLPAAVVVFQALGAAWPCKR